jgi:hypothetical protein
MHTAPVDSRWGAHRRRYEMVERCNRHIKDVLAIQEEIARAILLRSKNTIA